MNIREVCEYCIKCNFDEEKMHSLAFKLKIAYKIFEDRVFSYYYKQHNLIRSKIEGFAVKNEVDKDIYKKIGLDKKTVCMYCSHRIWMNASSKKYNYLKNPDEEKELKFMYNILINSDGLLGETIKILDVDRRELFIRASSYCNYGEGDYQTRKKEFYEKTQKFLSPSARLTFEYIIFDKILKSDSKEEIVDIIKKSGYELKELEKQIPNYLKDYKIKDKEKIIYKKLSLYNEYYKEELINKRKKEAEKKASIVILDFIESNTNSRYGYCKLNDIAIKTFKFYANIVKKRDPKLYKDYEEKIEKTNRSEDMLCYKVNKLVKILTISNKNKKRFDLIDYYLIFNCSLKKVFEKAKEILKPSEFKLISKFVNQNKKYENDNSQDIHSIYKSVVEVNCKKDKNGIPISGTGEIFELKDKKKIVKWLKENNIPLNIKTYTLAFKRYLDGEIVIEENIKKR